MIRFDNLILIYAWADLMLFNQLDMPPSVVSPLMTWFTSSCVVVQHHPLSSALNDNALILLYII